MHVINVWPGDQDGGLGALGTVHMCCYANTTRSHNTTHAVEDRSKSISTPCSQENEGIQPYTSFDYSCDSH